MEVETIAEESQKEGTSNAQAENAKEEAPVADALVNKSPSKKSPVTMKPSPKTQSPIVQSPVVQTPVNVANKSPLPKPTSSESPANESQATQSPAHPQEPIKKPRRDERNRKEEKIFDHYTKAVSAASTAEEKLSIASQKFAHLLDDNKKMQFYIKQSDKRHALVMKEKEQLQLEFNKTILLKSKLENLCRELQKQNKSIKDESLHKIREEEERRKETQAKFQSTLAEISTLLQQNNEKNAKLRDDNISMTDKFKSVVQQYQLREEQVEKMSKQMELETQLNAAKAQKASLEHQAEREQLQAEIEHLKLALMEYRARVNDLQGTETGLRGQLAVYTDKYDEFQAALMKSNQVFGGFKDQMEKMSKKIKKLEKESLSWKQRWESSQSALLDMCGERQAADARLLAIQRQLAHMQSLCRTLQAERTVLLGTLKENNIERPPLPAPVPAPQPEPLPVHSAASDAKVDAMAVNCAQLRQSLAHLQSQLNVLTTQQTQQEVPTQQDKPKKSKNRKNKAKKLKDSDESTSKETESSTTEDITESTAEAESTDYRTENEETAIETESSEADLGGRVDERVLETLMKAINIANVNLCDLDVADNNISIDEVIDGEPRVIEITDGEVQIGAKKSSESETKGTTEAAANVDTEQAIDSPITEAPKVDSLKTEQLCEVESPKEVQDTGSPKKTNVELPKSSPNKNEKTEVAENA